MEIIQEINNNKCWIALALKKIEAELRISYVLPVYISFN